MTDTISWDAAPSDLTADPTATIAMDRAAWERHGARFASFDDGLGRHPSIATGVVRTRSGEDVPIGVLDYGEATTFLLVEEPATPGDPRTPAVLDALCARGTVRASAILERLPAPPPARDTQRIAALEAQVAELRRQVTALSSGERRP